MTRREGTGAEAFCPPPLFFVPPYRGSRGPVFPEEVVQRDAPTSSGASAGGRAVFWQLLRCGVNHRLQRGQVFLRNLVQVGDNTLVFLVVSRLFLWDVRLWPWLCAGSFDQVFNARVQSFGELHRDFGIGNDGTAVHVGAMVRLLMPVLAASSFMIIPLYSICSFKLSLNIQAYDTVI